MMINALTTAAAGLKAASQRFEASAQNVVRASSGDSSGGDLAAAITDSKLSELSFKADAAVFKTAGKMLGTLIDTVA